MSGPVTVSPGLPGGLYSALNVITAAVIKGAPGILVRVSVTAAGTAGSLTLNDAATVGAAASGNQILTELFSALTAGQVIYLEWPCAAGIVVSSVPTGGAVSISFS